MTAISAEGQHLPARRGYALFTLASMAALIGLWHAAVAYFNVPPYILPPPLRVVAALWSGLAVSPLDPIGWYLPLWATVRNAGLGFVIGASLGFALGSLMAESRRAEALIMPYAFALQSLPKVAIAPLIVIWFGFGDGSKMVMAAMLTFFPMLISSFTGLRSTGADRIELMRSLGASRLETLLRVKVPSAAPYIFAGLDMGVVYALLGTIVAEFLGAQQGMGVAITKAQSVTDVASVFAALIILGTVGVTLHTIVRRIERRIVHWQSRT